MYQRIILFTLFIFSIVSVRATNPDIESLRKKFTDELLALPVDDNQIKELIATQNSDGTWPGINYEDVSNIAFQHTRHLSNMVQMSRAYKKKDSKYKGKKELKNALYLALDYWLAHDFICGNWWNNEIGTPNDLTAVLLMMDKDLTKEQIEKTLVITGRSHINAQGARQSGDRIKIAGIQAKNTLFKRDVEQFEMLMKVIEGEIRFVPDDQKGLQQDFSFHHREDRVNNTLSYGLGYADAFAEWAEKVAGTRYRFSEESLNLLIDYYLDGICKMMIFGKYHDPGATNRDISRPRYGDVRPASAITPERLLKSTSYRKDELQEIVNIRRNDVQPTLSHSTFFWQAEHYTHQRPDYFTSVRMFSTRNQNMEVPYNGEGLLNHHRGDGTNYLSMTGNEYFSLAPVYDWQKIPGATILQKSALPPENEIQKAGTMDFAGAVTNGMYGAVGFDFSSPHDPVKARKSWFFFDDEYVCLGAGITSGTNHPVVTTLDQNKLTGDVSINSSAKNGTLSSGEHQLENTKWVYHNHTGYLFPEPTQVILSNQTETGSWYTINRQTSTPREEIKQDVFKLWIDHGPRAKKAGYQYIVMPAASKSEVESASANPKVRILSNTSDLQAVQQLQLNILQAVFYKTGEVCTTDGMKINMDGPGIIMVKTDGDAVKEISVADPLRKLGKIYFNINRKINGKGDGYTIVWNEEKGLSEVSVDLPQGLFTGKSVTIRL